MAEQDLDRNESATPYKLQKAREKGQVLKSPDVISALVFAVAVVFITWQGWHSVSAQLKFDQAILMQVARMGHDPAVLWPLISQILRGTAMLLLPFFICLMLAAIAGSLVQTGPVFSFDPVKMDFDRLNPVNGLKRVFSMRTLFESARACVKLVLLTLVAYYALKSLAPQFYRLAGMSPQGFMYTLLQDIAALGLKMALILGLIAAVDFAYSRYEFSKKMRMSQREVKDENKHREGDPRIRARLRELRREMLKRSLALKKTRDADVILTNPTHFAVALRYEHGQMSSPQVIAKGAGQLAAAMRQIAAKHGIPVVQNPTLARKLFHEIEVEHHVPPHLYAQVARIIVWVFSMRERAAAARAGVTGVAA